MYQATTPPLVPSEQRELLIFVLKELHAISAEMGGPLLEELSVAPSKVKSGMVVLADGTHWDPGSGAGVYCYYGSAWHKLG